MAIPSKGKPAFIWQPILIVLPVLILAVIGFLFLRQDRALIRQEAAERAQVLADEMVTKVWAELLRTNESTPETQRAFQVDASGELLFPPPVPAAPIPKPLDTSKLESEQLRLWQNANREDASGSRPAAMDAYRQFVGLRPPSEFAGPAWYSLGLLLGAQGEDVAAAEALNTVLDKYPGARGESGIPLVPLAQAKLIETRSKTNLPPAKRLVQIELFYSNIVNNPTALTPYLLSTPLQPVSPSPPLPPPAAGDEETVRQKWLTVWREHEFSRDLYEAALHSRDEELRRLGQEVPRGEPQKDSSYFHTGVKTSLGTYSNSEGNTVYPLTPRFFWFRMNDQNWLCSRLNDPVPKTWFLCRTHQEIGSALAAALASTKHAPEYFGIYVEVGGAIMAQSRDAWYEVAHRLPNGGLVIWSSMLGPSAMLASASHLESGNEPLKVSIYLADAAALFKRQQVRLAWFGSIIAISSIAALIALFSAWRAFAQQQALTDLKTNFVSSVSHELRAPIASVRLMAESLERGKIQDSQKQSEYFRFIGQECRRLSGLIENVLDFSRIEQGRKEYQFEPTDLLSLTRETVAVMQTYAAEKHVRLNLVLPAEQGPEHSRPLNGEYQMSVDGRAIQQALINLIDNALKHSPEGETVTVGMESAGSMRTSEPHGRPHQPDSNRHAPTVVQNSGKRVLLWVEDRGPGIPAAEHERIFERFYRLGSELQRETPGVGIGLSIVKHVVEAHNGTVRVESDLGKGSRFTIELPD